MLSYLQTNNNSFKEKILGSIIIQNKNKEEIKEYFTKMEKIQI